MNSHEPTPAENAIELLGLTRQRLAETEQAWKELRETSKRQTISLITDHRISVAKASLISGHHRNTITTWLAIWNAENKNRN